MSPRKARHKRPKRNLFGVEVEREYKRKKSRSIPEFGIIKPARKRKERKRK